MIINRKTGAKKEIEYHKSVIFLYQTIFGRMILKILSCPFISKIVGKYMNSRFSIKRINKTIAKEHIDMSVYEKRDYQSFNDFFTRKKLKLHFDMQKNHFVSPCDAKLLVKVINDDASFNIKESVYGINDIIENDILNDYKDGYALIFRLEITDYHRYHFIDDGSLDKYHFIPGKLHTVQPIAYSKYAVFHTNSREYTILHTKNFGDIVMCEIGALLVGKIVNNKEISSFKRGDLKGYFEFGGSTIILFVKKDVIQIDDDIMNNSYNDNETIVSCGEKIGIKKI